MILPFLFSQSLCQANVNSPEAVADSASKMGTFLLDFYTNNPGPDGFGAILPSSASDVSGQQWYESGIFWGAIMDYQMIFKDTKFAETCSTALGLASGRSGSFLGDNKLLSATLLGKWNDDIAWWALAAMTGAEIYGPDAKLPSGNTYLKVAQITYDQIWEQHDDLCGGGIYWSRDRSSARSKGYKSTITSIYLIFNYLDAQAIMLGARLYRMTKNETYLKQAQGLADWLKTSGIINSQGQVYDGIDADTGCSVKQPFHSYIAGTVLGGYGWLFRVSQDSEFLTDGSRVLSQFNTLFVDGGIITDPCEPNCQRNQVPPKGTAIRGLRDYLLAITNEREIQTIKATIKSSTEAMLNTCDSSFNCGLLWSEGTKATERDFHATETSFEMIIAYRSSLVGIQDLTLSPVPGVPGVTGTTSTTKKSNAHKINVVGGLVLLATICMVAW